MRFGTEDYNVTNSDFNTETDYNQTSEQINNTAPDTETVNTSAAEDTTVHESEPAQSSTETPDPYSAYGNAPGSINWSGSTYSGRPSGYFAYDNPQAAQTPNQEQYRFNRYDNMQYGSAPYGAGQYGNGQYYSGPYGDPRLIYPYPQAIQPEKKKKKPNAFLRALRFTGAAILFGAIAFGVFLGMNELYYTINPGARPLTQAEREHPDISVNNSSLNLDPVTDSEKLISSTPLVDNVNSDSTDVSAIVEATMPSIVSISCTFNVQSMFGYYETSGVGTGIILKQTADELLIATNNHVVSDSTGITVTFNDDSSAPAVIKGTDSVADLAVISISLSDLTAETLSNIKVATLGSSDEVKVGQMAIAIGDAMGYGQSTTVGYISAKDRTVIVDNTTMVLLQTDAAINPGNSGGALLNINGEVIGINSVKYASEEVEGMGFAIPISRAEQILDELSNREILSEEEKGYLGVYIEDVTSSISELYNWPIGIYVSDLVEGGSAAAAGIQPGDIITAVNGTEVINSSQLKERITALRTGTTVQITVQRLTNGEFVEMTIDVVLMADPSLTPAAPYSETTP